MITKRGAVPHQKPLWKGVKLTLQWVLPAAGRGLGAPPLQRWRRQVTQGFHSKIVVIWGDVWKALFPWRPVREGFWGLQTPRRGRQPCSRQHHPAGGAHPVGAARPDRAPAPTSTAAGAELSYTVLAMTSPWLTLFPFSYLIMFLLIVSKGVFLRGNQRQAC